MMKKASVSAAFLRRLRPGLWPQPRRFVDSALAGVTAGSRTSSSSFRSPLSTTARSPPPSEFTLKCHVGGRFERDGDNSIGARTMPV